MSEQKLTEEQALKFAQLVNEVQTGKLQRRHIRYKLFRIRDGSYNKDDGLKEVIETQLKPNLQQNWGNFTHTWDVGANDPFKVIIAEEWVPSGGKFDELGLRTPPAFTKQE